jgi:hypothetical protein
MLAFTSLSAAVASVGDDTNEPLTNGGANAW